MKLKLYYVLSIFSIEIQYTTVGRQNNIIWEVLLFVGKIRFFKMNSRPLKTLNT